MDVAGYTRFIDITLLNMNHETGTYFLDIVNKRLGPKKSENVREDMNELYKNSARKI